MWQEGRDKANFGGVGGVNRTDDLRGKSSLAISGGGKSSNIFPHANSFHHLALYFNKILMPPYCICNNIFHINEHYIVVKSK